MTEKIRNIFNYFIFLFILLGFVSLYSGSGAVPDSVAYSSVGSVAGDNYDNLYVTDPTAQSIRKLSSPTCKLIEFSKNFLRFLLR